MTIEVPRELETQIGDMARAQGISVAEYLETLVTETNARRKQVSEFRAVIAERMASLNADDQVDGEEVMARLLTDRPWLGHAREDLLAPEIRFWPVAEYLILYVAARKPIEIVAVLHGS